MWLKPHRVNFTFHWKPLSRRRARRRHADPPALSLGAARSPPAAPPSGSGSTARSAVKRSVAAGRARRPAVGTARSASTPGRRRSRATPTATRSRRASTGCCSSMCKGTPTPATHACSRPRCARSSAATPGDPRACCSPPAGGPAYFERVARGGTRRSRRRRRSRTSSCRKSTTTTSACTSPATTSSGLMSVEAALVARRAAGGRRRSARPLSALRWRETRTGFVGAGLPAAHQDVGGIPPGNPVRGSSPLFMGFKSSLRRNQASEDDVTIPDGPFAAGHDDAGQLHAPAARQLVRAAQPERERVARMYAPQVTPRRPPNSPPMPRATRPVRRSGQPLRGDRALADDGARAARAASR